MNKHYSLVERCKKCGEPMGVLDFGFSPEWTLLAVWVCNDCKVQVNCQYEVALVVAQVQKDHPIVKE